jgi:hypothetical protein
LKHFTPVQAKKIALLIAQMPNLWKEKEWMMPDEQELQVGRAQGVALQPLGDGKHTAVPFKVKSGVTGAVLGPKEHSQLAAVLLDYARKVAASTPADVEGGSIEAMPIPITSMGIARGRTTDEAFLSLRLGQLTLTFSADTALLQVEQVGAGHHSGYKPATTALIALPA